MNNISRVQLTAALFAALALPAALTAHAAPPKAKITPQQADAAAVKRIPGKVLATKYEFEDGHWQYAVTVVNKKGQMFEAEVSAATGRVTATERTTPAEEAKEAAADARAAANANGANASAANAKARLKNAHSAEKGETGEAGEKAGGEAGEGPETGGQ